MVQNMSKDLNANSANSYTQSQRQCVSRNVTSAPMVTLANTAPSPSGTPDASHRNGPKGPPGSSVARPELQSGNVGFQAGNDLEKKQKAVQEALEKKREADRLYQEALQQEQQFNTTPVSSHKTSHYQHSNPLMATTVFKNSPSSSQGASQDNLPNMTQTSHGTYSESNRNNDEPQMSETVGHPARFAHDRQHESESMGIGQFNNPSVIPAQSFNHQHRPQNPAASQGFRGPRNPSPFFEDPGFRNDPNAGHSTQFSGSTMERDSYGYNNEQYDYQPAQPPREAFQRYPASSGHQFTARHPAVMRGPRPQSPIRSRNPLSTNKVPASLRFPEPRQAFPDFGGSGASENVRGEEWSECVESERDYGGFQDAQIRGQNRAIPPRGAARGCTMDVRSMAPTRGRGMLAPWPGATITGGQRPLVPMTNRSSGGSGVARFSADQNFSDDPTYDNSNIEGDAFYNFGAEAPNFNEFSAPKFSEYSKNVDQNKVVLPTPKVSSSSSVASTNNFTSNSKTQPQSTNFSSTDEPSESVGYRVARNVAKSSVSGPKAGIDTVTPGKRADAGKNPNSHVSAKSAPEKPEKPKTEIKAVSEDVVKKDATGEKECNGGDGDPKSNGDPNAEETVGADSGVKEESAVEGKESGCGVVAEAADLDLDVIKAALKSLAPAEDEEDDIERQVGPGVKRSNHSKVPS